MAGTINQLTLVGRLGETPNLRKTSSGTSVTTLRLAIDKPPHINSDELAGWFDVTVWRKTAELCCTYLRKGRSVAIQGWLQNRSFTDEEGNTRWQTEITATNVQFL